MPDTQELGTAWIYRRIQEFCDDRVNGIGGFYQQLSYKKLFFDIFVDALVVGYAGSLAQERLKRRKSRLKKKKIPERLYVVNEHSIREYLERNWLLGKKKRSANREMVTTLCRWWDSWEFAVTLFPPDLFIPRRRRRIKESFMSSLR